MAKDMRPAPARSGDPNDSGMPWHKYPTFTNRDETKGKTESPNSGQAARPGTSQREVIDVLKRMP